MNSDNAGVRLIGVATLRRLIDGVNLTGAILTGAKFPERLRT